MIGKATPGRGTSLPKDRFVVSTQMEQRSGWNKQVMLEGCNSSVLRACGKLTFRMDPLPCSASARRMEVFMLWITKAVSYLFPTSRHPKPSWVWAHGHAS